MVEHQVNNDVFNCKLFSVGWSFAVRKGIKENEEWTTALCATAQA